MEEELKGFEIDEEPLREWILKAYHEKQQGEPRELQLLDAVRECLSGAPGARGGPDHLFVEAPEEVVPQFLRRLEELAPGLKDAIYAPLLHVLDGKSASSPGTSLAPNLSVYIASLSGPIALKTNLDETIVCALLSTALLTLARLGAENVNKLLEDSAGPTMGASGEEAS